LVQNRDVGYQDPLDDGRLYLVGRARELIITGGYNVYPKEVETPLKNMKPFTKPRSSESRMKTTVKR